jgi:hypothetical protein
MLMKRRSPSPTVVVAAIVLAAAALTSAAQTTDQHQPPQGNVVQPSVYRPGLGDLMTMTVQPRHIKLALAGREKNWVYAAYELHELQEAFERVAHVWPVWRSVPIAELVSGFTQKPMTLAEQAIKARDSAQFASAYEQLTNACNTCHQSAGRGMIAIQVPTASTFPDQDFQPQDDGAK